MKIVLAIAALAGAALLGCGSDDGSDRAVEWRVDPPVGSNWTRLSASIEVCHFDPPLLERPIVMYDGNRVYIELRRTPEELSDDVNGCLLQLLGAFKKITFNRDLDKLVLFDASTDPPEQRWPRKKPWPEATIRAVPWTVAAVSGPRTITIASEVGYCAGFPKPRMARVRTRYAGKDAFIRAEVAFPKYGPAKGEICGGVGYPVSEAIRLKRPLGSLKIYDASRQPPIRRGLRKASAG